MKPIKQTTRSERETQQLGARLARAAYHHQPAFVRLSGPLGSGKSAFARGFIQAWLALAGETTSESVISPTYNIARVYGKRSALAHLDLYRVRNLRELEQLGFEHYFFEHACCIVEWLEHVPEALAAMPASAIQVELAFEGDPNDRAIILRIPTGISLTP